MSVYPLWVERSTMQYFAFEFNGVAFLCFTIQPNLGWFAIPMEVGDGLSATALAGNIGMCLLRGEALQCHRLVASQDMEQRDIQVICSIEEEVEDALQCTLTLTNATMSMGGKPISGWSPYV